MSRGRRIGKLAIAGGVAALALLIGGGALAARDGDQITGFGATVAAWKAGHQEDRRGNLIRGCCYDPIASHSGVRYADRYFGVQPIGGRVISYEIWTGDGTSTAAARQVALRELPPDARVTSFNVHGSSCAILIAHSNTLAKALHHGTVGGGVVVEFSSGPDGMSYDPRSVNDLLFSSLMIAGPSAQNC